MIFSILYNNLPTILRKWKKDLQLFVFPYNVVINFVNIETYMKNYSYYDFDGGILFKELKFVREFLTI